MDDYLDRDAVLFGGDDPPADGSFDPFLPGLGQEGDATSPFSGEANGHNGSDDSASIYEFPNDGTGVGDRSADGYRVIEQGDVGGDSIFQSRHYGGDQVDKSDDDRSLPWEGTGAATVLGAAERAAREAADTGNRNIRRTAEQHDRSAGEGAGGNRTSHSTEVDSSISAAAQRIRSEIAGPVDIGRRSSAIEKFVRDGHLPMGPRQYQKTGITAPPRFMATDFEAMLMGLKANASGDWIVTIKIDQQQGDRVFPLNGAFGLALDMRVERHSPRSDDLHT